MVISSTVLTGVLPALAAFVVAMILGKITIPFLRRLKFGQYIREEGPKSHQKKAGTPTMGGIIFLLGFVAGSLVCCSLYPKFWIVVAVTLGFGLIGLMDDFIKIVLKHNEGLKAWQKFALQFLVSCGFALYLYLSGFGTVVEFRIFNASVDFGFFYYGLVVFALMAIDNGTNFTDGLDGLCSFVTLVICFFFIIVAGSMGSELTVVSSAMAGGLLGFLYFNCHPARVFMGDTGSLALGGFVGAMAFLLNMPFMVLIFGFIYVLEVVSVILQVGYFKLTHGKRLFKMAPIHHHFELKGWDETKVVAIFTIVTIVLCAVSLVFIL